MHSHHLIVLDLLSNFWSLETAILHIIRLFSSFVICLHLQFPASQAPTRKPAHSNRRVSLPLPTKTASHGSPWKPDVGVLDCVKSPDVSVNAPRIDRMAEFPLASYEEPFTPVRRTSSTSAQGSSSSPQGDCTIMKDKCTVQVWPWPPPKTFPQLLFMSMYGVSHNNHILYTTVSSN